MPDENMKDVPPEKVGEIVQSFITNDGATKVTAHPQADGKWTVTAALPD